MSGCVITHHHSPLTTHTVLDLTGFFFVCCFSIPCTGGTSSSVRSRRGSRTPTTSRSQSRSRSGKRSAKRGRSKTRDEEGEVEEEEEEEEEEGEDTGHDGNQRRRRSNTGTPMETETEELVLQETIEEVGGSDPDFEGPARKKQKKKKSPPVGNTCCCLNVHDSSFNFLLQFQKGRRR